MFPRRLGAAMVAIIFAFFWGGAAWAQSCSGSGCRNIILEKVNGCFRFRNTGRYPVKIVVGAYFSSPTVYSGTPETIYFFSGECLKGFDRLNYKATQIGGPPPKPRSAPVHTPVAPVPSRVERSPNTDIRLPTQYRFRVDDQCNRPIEMAVLLLNTDGKWETKRWVTFFGPAIQFFPDAELGRDNFDLFTYNKTAYVQAHIEGTSILLTSKHGDIREVDGYRYIFQEINVSGDQFNIKLSCNNITDGMIRASKPKPIIIQTVPGNTNVHLRVRK